MKSYDLAIIGSGPGGYVTGIYAARHNLKVCIIEKDLLGGTCLNKGCIPTKSLINSASIFSRLSGASACGILLEKYSIDFQKMLSRKDEVVLRLRNGVEALLNTNRIDLLRGVASINRQGKVSVGGLGDIDAKDVIIAAGSKVSGPPNLKIDDEVILSSDSILNIGIVPKSLMVVGGGAIGCEFASLFNKLGAKITIVEMSDRLVPAQSREISKRLEYKFKKSGIDVITSSTVESAEVNGTATVKITGGKVICSDKILVSTGRVANIIGLGLDDAGIKTESGKICTDQYLRTTARGIYAIGDCVSGPQLAHKASYDGMVACDNILGNTRKVDYSNIPNCIWTDPEIASVGLSEESAAEMHQNVKTAKFHYLASGKAYLEGDTEGFVKLIGSPDGHILGVEIFGKDACNLIGEAVLAKTARVNIRDWGRVVHGHPTLSEMFSEACGVF